MYISEIVNTVGIGQTFETFALVIATVFVHFELRSLVLIYALIKLSIVARNSAIWYVPG